MQTNELPPTMYQQMTVSCNFFHKVHHILKPNLYVFFKGLLGNNP